MSRALNKLAKKLKKLREEQKITQEELAFRCNLDRTCIARIETLKRSPNLETLEKLANGIGVPLHELLNFKN